MKKIFAITLLLGSLSTGFVLAADVPPILDGKDLPEGFALITAKNFNSLRKDDSADSVYQDFALRPAAYADEADPNGSWTGMRTGGGIHVDGYPATGNASLLPRWMGGPKNVGTDNLPIFQNLAAQGVYGPEVRTISVPGVVWGKIWQPANSGAENAPFMTMAVTDDKVIIFNITGASQAGVDKRVAEWNALPEKQREKTHPDRSVLTLATAEGILLKIIERVTGKGTAAGPANGKREERIRQLEELIAAKNTEIDKQKKETDDWLVAMQKANIDAHWDDLGKKGKDPRKKLVIDMNAQQKFMSGQEDDTEGNLKAIKGYYDKAQERLGKLMNELYALDQELITLRPPKQVVGPQPAPAPEAPRKSTSPENTYAIPRNAKQ